MIAYIRSVQYQMSAEPVGILVEIHSSEAAFLDPMRRPLGSFYANTTQTDLQALVTTGGTWGDAETLAAAQPVLDAHEDWGALALTLQLAPTPPSGVTP